MSHSAPREYYNQRPPRAVNTTYRRDSYDPYETRPPGRLPAFLQRSDSIKNERALVLLDRYGRPTTGNVYDDRADVSHMGRSRPLEIVTGETQRWSRSRSRSPRVRSRERFVEREPRSRSPPIRIRERIVEREPRSPYDIVINRGHDDISDSLTRDRSSMKDVQVVLGPQFDRNTTVHLELDVEVDMESQLEEFSHLKRLGNFRAAEQYFRTNLYDKLDVPPVAVEYAEMLLQQGAYQRLRDLLRQQELKTPVPPSRESSPILVDVPVAGPSTREKNRKVKERPVVPGPKSAESMHDYPHQYTETRVYEGGNIKSDAEKFDLAFRLIKHTAKMQSEGRLRQALSVAEDAESEFLMHRSQRRPVEDSVFSSTELQLIAYYQDIQSHVSRRSDFAREKKDFWSLWSGLYDSLRQEGRIWELADVISSSLTAHGGTKTWDKLLDKDLCAADFFEEFLDDWKVNEQYDESSYLAILAILVDLCNALLSLSEEISDREIAAAKRCLEHGRRFAACIKENDPTNVKSRPYISWIIAQKSLERYLLNSTPDINSLKSSFNPQYLHSLPGLIVETSRLPIYIPMKAEAPGWPVLPQSSKSDEILQHALKASQELGDYKTEVACLREMICHSSQPQQLFERLIYVQKTLQGDMVGYLETLLSKYLLVTDKESGQNLYDELSAVKSYELINDHTYDPLLQWCQWMVQVALYRFLGRHPADVELLEQKAISSISSLPLDVYGKVLNQSLLGFPPEPTYSRRNLYNRRFTPPQPARRAEYERREYYDSGEDDIRRDIPNKQRDEERHINRELERKKLLGEKRNMESKINSEEAMKKAAQEAEKENEERKYQARLEADLRKAGFDPHQIAVAQGHAQRPLYTRIARRHISLEALQNSLIDYELDQDPDYVIIKRWLTESEQHRLFEATRKIRARRGSAEGVPSPLDDHDLYGYGNPYYLQNTDTRNSKGKEKEGGTTHTDEDPTEDKDRRNIASGPDSPKKATVVEEYSSPQTATKRPNVAHVESVEDIDDVARKDADSDVEVELVD